MATEEIKNKDDSQSYAPEAPDTGWTDDGHKPEELSERSPQSAEPGRIRQSELTKKSGKQQGVQKEYIQRFLQPRKVKDYSPVYIDVRMKEKLAALIASLQHLAPDITPTMLLSNMLGDHLRLTRIWFSKSPARD